jgi:hypothetical protein
MPAVEHERSWPDYRASLAAYERAWQQYQDHPSWLLEITNSSQS